MYLSEDESRERVNDPRNLANVVPSLSPVVEVEHRTRSGYREGQSNLSPAIRAIIADAAKFKSKSELAAIFKVTPETVRNYTRGISSHSSNGKVLKNEELIESTQALEAEKKDQIRSQALEVLMASIDGLGAKMKDLSATQRSQVAREMATVHSKLGDDGTRDGTVRVIVYSPKQLEVADYDVIDAPYRVVNE